jgi:uncharacterized protein (DUF2236 family)
MPRRPAPTAFERYSSEGALVLAGGAAILLQLGDPVVAAGVAAHSAFARDPMRRLRGTMQYVYAIGLGDGEQRALVAGSVDRAHAGVPGARDAEHQLWVAATLYEVGRGWHERLFGPMGDDLADEVYAASARLGTALQLPDGAWPGDRAAFARYWAEAVAGLEVGAEARQVAAQLLHPAAGPWWMRAAMPLGRVLTAGLLPDAVRVAYGLPHRPRAFAAATAFVRVLVRVVPFRLRSLPAGRLLAELAARAGRSGRPVEPDLAAGGGAP